MIENIAWNYNPNRDQNGFSLNPIKSLLKSLNNPELKIPFPIHVVGTNGKGSTIAFLNAILHDAGYKVNSYTSPNLIYLNERIKISSNQISDEALLKRMSKIPQNVSFFEALTAVAFCEFAESDADISLIEAGLGGRLDATNVIDSKLCILTSVSLDHTEFLGNSITKIAREKLAVQKKSPFIIAQQPYKEVYRLAEKIPNPIVYGKDFKLEYQNNKIIYHSQSLNTELINPALKGNHQFYNASSAIAGIDYLISQCGFNITKDNIQNGIQQASWQGRLEKITKGKIKNSFKHLEVFIDGAHNENSIQNILSEFLDQQNELHIICGFLKRKNLEDIIPKFTNFKNIHITEIYSSEKCYTMDELKELFAKYNIQIFATKSNFFEILQSINQSSKVLILGSLYLVGEVLKWNYES